MSLLPRCPRCGLANTLATATCRSCGQSLAVGAVVPVARGSSRVPVSHAPPAVAAHGTSVARAGGGGASWWRPNWRVVQGRVINVDAPYMAGRETDWGMLALKAFLVSVLALLLGPIIIGAALGLFVVWLMFSLFFPKRGGGHPGILSNAFSHGIGYLFSKRLNRAAADVPVRDVRVRDAGGAEHLVRLRGDIVSGGVNVGDDIVAEGPNRGGTLLFRRGWNSRINSEIRLRER